MTDTVPRQQDGPIGEGPQELIGIIKQLKQINREIKGEIGEIRIRLDQKQKQKKQRSIMYLKVKAKQREQLKRIVQKEKWQQDRIKELINELTRQKKDKENIEKQFREKKQDYQNEKLELLNYLEETKQKLEQTQIKLTKQLQQSTQKYEETKQKLEQTQIKLTKQLQQSTQKYEETKQKLEQTILNLQLYFHHYAQLTTSFSALNNSFSYNSLQLSSISSPSKSLSTLLSLYYSQLYQLRSQMVSLCSNLSILSQSFSSFQSHNTDLQSQLLYLQQSKKKLLHQFKIHQQIRDLQKKNLRMQSDMRLQMKNKIAKQCDSLRSDNQRLSKQLDYYLQKISQFQSNVQELKRRLRWVQSKIDPKTFVLELTPEEFHTYVVIQDNSDDQFAIPEMNYHKSQKQILKQSLKSMQQKYSQLQIIEKETNRLLQTYSLKVSDLQKILQAQLQKMKSIQQENMKLSQRNYNLQQMLAEKNRSQKQILQENENLMKLLQKSEDHLAEIYSQYKKKVQQYQNLLQHFQNQNKVHIPDQPKIDNAFQDYLNEIAAENSNLNRNYNLGKARNAQIQKGIQSLEEVYRSVQKQYNVSSEQKMKQIQIQFFKKDVHKIFIQVFGKQIQYNKRIKHSQMVFFQFFAYKQRDKICKTIQKLLSSLKRQLTCQQDEQSISDADQHEIDLIQQVSNKFKKPKQARNEQQYINDNNSIKFDERHGHKMSNFLLFQNLQQAISQVQAQQAFSESSISNDNNSNYSSQIQEQRMMSQSPRSAGNLLKGENMKSLKNQRILAKLRKKK